MHCPLLVSLAFAVSTAASTTAQTAPAIAAPTQRTGDEINATLPLQAADGRNVAEQTYTFAVEPGTSVTVRVESADFDAVLVVQRGMDDLRDEDSGPWTDPWLVVAAEDADTLTIRVGAHDARGGEFRLSVRAGADTPPKGLDAIRSDGAACAAIARRAKTLGDTARAREHWIVAGRIATATHDYTAAEEAWNSVLESCVGDAAREAELEAKLTLGAVHRSLGNLTLARQELDAITGALDTFAASATNEREVRLAAQWLTILHDNLGDIDFADRGSKASIAHYRAATDAASRCGRKDFEITMGSKLARALDESGDAGGAESALQKCLASAEASGLSNLIAEALLGQARFLLHRGRSKDAKDSCMRALDLERRPWIRADLLGTLAAACRELGHYDEALARLDELEALIHAQRLEGYAVSVHIERGTIAWQLFDLEPARFELEAALKILDDTGSNDQRAAVLVNLALVLREQQESTVARERLQQAVDASRRVGDHTVEARAWQALGKLSEDERDLKAALTSYQRVVDIGIAADDTLLVGLGKTGTAHIHWLDGDADQARVLASESVESLEPLGWNAEALDARMTLALVALKQRALDDVDRELAAADRLMTGQAARRLDPFHAAGLRSRFAEWGTIEQELADLRVAEAASSAAVARDRWLRVGRWKTRVLLEGLHPSDAPQGADLSTAPELAPTTALIEYVEGIDTLYAYCVNGEKVRLVDLGVKADAAAAARRFAHLAADPQCGVQEFSDLGHALFERLLAPALSVLGARPTMLVLVPTAELATVPFEALVTARATADAARGFGALRYLIDDYLVLYAPSSHVLAWLQRMAPLEKRQKHLIAGYALYGAEQAAAAGQEVSVLRRSSASLASMRDLPESRLEIVELARLLLQRDTEELRAHGVPLLELQSKRSGELHARDFDLYLGDRACVELLRGDLDAYSHIYFAVHGIVDARDPRRSGLVFSWNPRDGGLFTLEEIVGLNLTAQCVVLSACDTAAGRMLRGEGVQSLAAGFLRAGARSVVASLWSVEDRDAMQVLRRFESFSLGADTKHAAQALRDAKLDFLRSAEGRGEAVDAGERHSRAPWQWAGFIYVGAPPR